MARILTMPSLSPSMEQGVIESWAKKVGDSIKSGEVLAHVETDKAVVEYEMLDDGVLRHFFVQKGDSVAVGKPIAIIADSADENIQALIAEGEQSAGSPKVVAMPKGDSQAIKIADHPTEIAPPSPVIEPPKPKEASDGRFKASPLARKMAEDMGIDVTKVRGTGPGGRIVKVDVELATKRLSAAQASAAQTTASPGAAAVPKAPSASLAAVIALEGECEEIPLTSMRKTIAVRLLQATNSIPHFYLTVKVRVDALMDLRQQLNTAKDLKISINDMIIKACGNALMDHPLVNTRYTETALLQFKNAHIGFAVATPVGLITPIIRNVNQKGLGQVAKEAKDMAARAKEKKLKPDEFSGGTFGTSNLGMFGIDQFTAIINPPQACNLAISGAHEEIQLNEAGQVIKTRQMKLTLSCDHRVVDGAVGAAYLKTLKNVLENPIAIML